MSGDDIFKGALAIAVLVILSKLFGDSKEDRENKRTAKEFDALGELFDSRAAHTAMMEGRVSSSQFGQAAAAGGSERIGKATAKLATAPATWYAWEDDNDAVRQAFGYLATYPEILLFVEAFAAAQGSTPGDFTRSFITGDLRKDDVTLAAVVRHVKKLRQNWNK